MPSGDTPEEGVSPEERFAIAEAKSARRTVEIFWLICLTAAVIFGLWLYATLKYISLG